MKTSAYAARWAAAVLLVASVVLGSPTSHAQSGLVGSWKFDETSGTSAADASGSSNTGTLANGPTWVSGRVNGAINFPTSTSQVNVANSGNLSDLYLNGMTVVAWIKPNATNSGRIVDKNNAVSDGTGWHFGMNGTNAVHFSGAQFAASSATRTSTTTITVNAWNHVVATWDGSANGSGIHVYINGVLSDAGSANGSGAAESDSLIPLTIGNRPVDNNRRFNGAIDEVRIFSRVLTLSEIQALADSTVPSTPSGLGATPVSGTQINLSWTASTDNVAVTGYRVERCTGASCSNYAEIGTPTGTTFNSTGLTVSTTYRFRVRATDANTNFSSYSSVVNATTTSGGDTQAPTAPTGLSATPVSSSQINLSWTASTDNVAVTGYRVERCQGSSCSNFAEVGTPSGTTFNDNTGLSASTTYRYRVRAQDAVPNFSSYSSTVNATTQAPGDTQAPTAPSGLMVVATSSTEVDIVWTGSTDNVAVTAYLVERCSGSGCSNFTQVAAPTATKFDDTGRTPSTTYRYRIRAQDAVPNYSTYSNIVSIATPASSPDCD